MAVVSVVVSIFGSSPHTRGTRAHPAHRTRGSRFIPAYAGNASELSPASHQRPVHPRIRGERVTRRASMNDHSGSSPHTRGTPVPRDIAELETRFIPAYAGNACWTRCGRPAWTVHPRIRGERAVALYRAVREIGSSPHTRGTRGCGRDTVYRDRFIPAYAGNAYRPPVCRPRRPVHPRIRGERSFVTLDRPCACGSSPHTRGTLRYT